MKKSVLICLDEDIHQGIKELYVKEHKNLSSEVNAFLINELADAGINIQTQGAVSKIGKDDVPFPQTPDIQKRIKPRKPSQSARAQMDRARIAHEKVKMEPGYRKKIPTKEQREHGKKY